MNKNGNFAVVRRPSSAVEKAAPGAKRILSGMVADALALAKKKPSPRIVVVDDEEWCLELFSMLIQMLFKEVTLLKFQDSETAWQELSQADPDLLILDMPLVEPELLPLLAEKKVKYPILVTSGFFDEKQVLERADPNLNISFTQKPFDIETLRNELETALKIRRDAATHDEAMSINSRPLNRRGALLVVDDEEGIREIMRVIFENEYDLFIAEDAVTAIELAQQHDIDVTVTDINMAGMSGIDLLERLKYMKPDMEVMMMTALETNETRHKAFLLGACDYINAPFDVPTIRAAVSKAMRRRKIESEITVSQKTPGCNTDKFSDQPLQTRPLRIVMVDDDAYWLEFIVELIREWFKDAELVTFTSVAAVVRELEQREPDLLITGAKMPIMDGEILVGMLVRRMKAKNVNYPILVLSGFEPAQMWVREYASRGFNVGFLSKSALQDNGQLKRSIEEMLNRQRSK